MSATVFESLQFRVGKALNFSYLLWDTESGEAAVIDPSFDTKEAEAEISSRGLKLRYILLTHHHNDHVQEATNLRTRSGARIAAHSTSTAEHDIGLEDGETVRLGSEEVKLLHTPGHTVDSSCYLAGSKLFTGDTLFIGECGRVDLEDSSAECMYESLLVKIPSLPDETTVYPGHDYGKTPISTLGEEKKSNYTLQPRSKEEFLQFMRS